MTAGRDRELVYLHYWGKNYLKENGIDDYVISAEILLCHIMNMSRSDILLNPRQNADQSQVERYKEVILRRAKHEPLQYLVGHVDFYNVRIKCDPRALIPRPETEMLVEIVLDILKDIKSPRILDIGTGSGNIAIALAKNIDDATVLGLDISGKALELARENSKANEVEERVDFIAGDIFDRALIDKLDIVDCVVSNPPYVAEYEMDKLQPEVIEFEPAEALFCPGDPLKFFKAIIEFAPGILNRGGLLAFEVGLGQAEVVKGLMSTGFVDIRLHEDLAGINRIVTGNLKKE